MEPTNSLDASELFWSSREGVAKCYSHYLETTRRNAESGCRVLQMSPSKVGGYVQVTVSQAMFFRQSTTQLKVLAHHLPIMLTCGRRPADGEDASHLCGNPLCIAKEHLIIESKAANQRRKNCPVYIQCPHCQKILVTCEHNLQCYKAGVEGVQCEAAERQRERVGGDDGAGGAVVERE